MQGRDAKALSDFLFRQPQLKRDAVSADAGEPRAVGRLPMGTGCTCGCEFDALSRKKSGVTTAGIRGD